MDFDWKEYITDPNWLEVGLGVVVAVFGFWVGVVKILGGFLRRKRERRAAEQGVVRALLIELQRHRALFHPLAWEVPPYVAHSVLEMRKELTKAETALPPESWAIASIRAMQEACQRYLTATQDSPRLTFSSTNILLAFLEGISRDSAQRTRMERQLLQLRRIFEPEMERLYDHYKIARPPRRPPPHPMIGEEEKEFYVIPDHEFPQLPPQSNKD